LSGGKRDGENGREINQTGSSSYALEGNSLICHSANVRTISKIPRPLASLSVYGLVLACAACATNTTVKVIDNKYPPTQTSCEIQYFKQGKPQTTYETLAKVESHIQRNMFLGGAATLEDTYDELRAKACAVGGNGVIIDDHVESSASEFSHVHVWATVIRLK
jgi:hypothetical protein